MRSAALLILLVLGCADRPSHDAPRESVVIPPWLAAHPDLEAEARAEIEAVNLPPDWQVVVELPKFARGDQLYRGLCEYDAKRITVGFRFWPCEDRPLLVALEHEAKHAVSGNRCEGHDPLTCR